MFCRPTQTGEKFFKKMFDFNIEIKQLCSMNMDAVLATSLKPIEKSARSKQARVMAEIHRLAKRLGPGAKLPTVRGLSKQLDVNSVTLNKCLEKLEARGVLWCRQGSGIYVAAGVNQKRIAMVFGANAFDRDTIGFGSLMVRHAAKFADHHSRRFGFFVSDLSTHGIQDGRPIPVHQDLANALRSGKIDGIILLSRNSAEQEEWLRSQGVPVLAIDTFQGEDPTTLRENVFYFDYESLIRQGVEELHTAGCRTMGFVTASLECEELFRTTLRQRQIPVQEHWILNCSEWLKDPLRSHESCGTEMAQRLLSECGRRAEGAGLCDGLLISDDVIASGFLPVLASHGIRVGKDLVVCSHGNKGADALTGWNILRMQFDIEELASLVIDRMDALLASTPPFPAFLVKPISESNNP